MANGKNLKERAIKDRLTVEDVIKSIMPSWNFPHDWFVWPPDTFLMTSTILKRTGCYRYVLSKNFTTNLHKQGAIEDSAIAWIKDIDPQLQEPHKPISANFLTDNTLLYDAIEKLKRLSGKVAVYDLNALRTEEEENGNEEIHQRARALCSAIVTIHVIADEACSGFGLMNSSSSEVAFVHYLANLLLTSRGTLSAVSKYHGVVIPKLRTPQSGLSLRSFSHHVTYHTTEVEVIWRTLPWDNIEENTINILAVPYPYEVEAKYFRLERESFEPVRYFKYKKEDSETTLDQVIKLLENIDKGIGRVHILAFPELALKKESDYDYLLGELRKKRMQGKLKHVPMVITGVRCEDKGEFNQVRLAAYFASRWYNLAQHKHHRWKLDSNQIRQYSLEGRLSTSREWYENISIDQRRLTFLVPNGWLALCPLICEDLAQLEPVSEVIRGVGPTLLVALLFDGPQLKERWSARYASVLADDPGTAVLTLTSAGMAKRSRDLSKDTHDPNSEIGKTVALWKDQITGWNSLRLGETKEAILLTASADWVEEYTADGRSDHRNASVFKFEGKRRFSLEGTTTEESEGKVEEEASDVEDYQPDFEWRGNWLDIKELSAATFALDTLVKLEGHKAEIITDWLSIDEL
ncbi:MAG: hypothetical protein AAF944_01055 [Bacteroidota bacterium]